MSSGTAAPPRNVSPRNAASGDGRARGGDSAAKVAAAPDSKAGRGADGGSAARAGAKPKPQPKAKRPPRNPARGFRLSDVMAATALLTRTPVGGDHAGYAARGGQPAWAFPFVGAVIGLFAGLVFAALSGLGLPGGLAAAAALGVQAMITGGLHEDGLADCADGLGGGRTREHAIEIMRDSRIGSYGAIALVLVLLMQWSALSGLNAAEGLAALTMVGAMSRGLMAGAMRLPAASQSGLAASAGRPSWLSAFIAVSFGLGAAVIAWPIFGWPALFAPVFAGLAAMWVMRMAIARLGGVTGDVYGAVQQAAAAAALATLTIPIDAALIDFSALF